MACTGRLTAVAPPLGVWVAASLAVGFFAVPNVASAAPAKPSIDGFRFIVSQATSAQRDLTIDAIVWRARRCFISSPRLTGRRKRAVACSGRGSGARLHSQFALSGLLSAEGFDSRLTIEAVGSGGTTKVSFRVKVARAHEEPSVGIELADREEPAREADAARHVETELREGQEREGREASERHEREEREQRGAGGALTLAGDGVMVGLLEKLAAAYREAGFETTITITTLANGTDATAVSEGRYDIGLSASNPSPEDPRGLVFSKIAREGICVITNDDDPITNMTEATVGAIFTGRLVNWGEVPGAFVAGPIHVFDYEASVPTREAFESMFLGEQPNISPGATSELSEELMRNAVAGDRDAIGFARVGKTAGANAVGYDGVPCTVEAAHTGQYIAVRNLWLVTKGEPAGEGLTFMNWIQESAAARSIIESDWLTR